MEYARWWKDLSVSKKLYGVVGVMAVLIALELFTLMFAMDVLSAVRAFVGGEGLWSKAQKNAILEIQNYVISRDEKHYQAFLENLKVPLGDRRARKELAKADMNLEIVYQGFLDGRNHPDDLPAMVRLIRRFANISYIAKAIDVWGRADVLADELETLSHQIHDAIARAKKNEPIPDLWIFLAKISRINDEITVLEDEFSFTLGEASRWLEGTLMFILFIAVFLVESTGLFLTFRFSRQLTRALSELNSAALAIGEGRFTQTVPVRSRDELGQLAGAINKMAGNLHEITGERALAEEASQVKSLFLANMSHEIRTPLGAMLGFVELLKDPGTTAAERVRYLDVISRTGDTLVTIINDILDISKVEAGKVEINKEAASLPRLLRDLETLLQLRCEGKGIYLTFRPRGEVPEVIVTDPVRLRQILLNIVGNAIKFTIQGGVVVTYWVEKQVLYFSVKDSGPGITREQQGKLFRAFSQGDLSIRKAHGGTGLGLTLSRKLAQLMGGDVVLQSTEPGSGSVFTIHVGYEPPGALAVKPKPVGGVAVSLENRLVGKKILLVEDAPENQTLISLFLDKSGAKVELANNGLEGVRMAWDGDFDVVLMDMQMPVMDGYAATEELRRRGYKKPIIALTAHAMKEDLDKCLRSGCEEVIAKPVKRAYLIERVEERCQQVSGT